MQGWQELDFSGGDSRSNLNFDETSMTGKEVVEIVKESNLWAALTEGEQQEVLNHVLACSKPIVTELNVEDRCGEVYLAQ